MILKSIAGVLTLIAIVVVPMAFLWYGSAALGWGFRNYPGGRTWLALLGFAGLLIFAAMTFGRVAPGCYGVMMMTFGECR